MRATFRAQVSNSNVKFESDDPLGDQLQSFNEKLGLVSDSSDEALEMMKQWYKITGREWDDTPVTQGMVVTRSGEKTVSENVGMEALNVEYSTMGALNRKIAQGGK